MTIAFAPFFERLQKQTDISSQTDLARVLHVNRSAVTQAKQRDAVPIKWVLALSRRYALSPDWLEFGIGSPRPEAPVHSEGSHGSAGVSPAAGREGVRPSALLSPIQRVVRAYGTGQAPQEDLVYVPKASARLCAGGGSFEVEALPVAEYPMSLRWLSRMGNPVDMIFMDVVGDSMEPGIYDGDMVLVDQSQTRVAPNSVLAVGVEDAIYLKRVEERHGGVLLHSDNNRYSPMELFGDELQLFRIIGKVVWLCRDCRLA